MSNERKSLRDFLKEQSAQLPFMDGREKGDANELLTQVITITDYGFLTNEAGEPYACFTIAERPNKFYFGGQVLTEKLTLIENNGYGDELRENGLEIILVKKQSRKSSRPYIDVTFAE